MENGDGRVKRLMEQNGEKLRAFRELLLEYNRKFNLTAITEEREVEIKHFYDSLAGEFLFPRGAKVFEVGSGAGFPSIPLKIAREDLRFTLIESVRKKCDFLRAAIAELKLGGTEVVCARAEDIARDAAFREKADIVCARAVAGFNTLAEYCLPLVKKGGAFVAYKGERDEWTAAHGAIGILGGGSVETFSYALPLGMGARTLVRVEKVSRTPAKYPRGKGKERSDPLL